MKYVLKIFKFCFWLIFILLLLINLTLLFSKYVLKKTYPNFFGYTYFSVLTGSMSNEINVGDIIIVKINDNYNVGDVVTYQSLGKFITHRVIRIEENVVITKGDINNVIDEPVNKEFVVGKVVKNIRKAGILIRVITSPKVVVLLFLIVMVSTYIISEIEKRSDEN